MGINKRIIAQERGGRGVKEKGRTNRPSLREIVENTADPFKVKIDEEYINRLEQKIKSFNRFSLLLEIKLFTIKLKNSLLGRTRSSPETHDSKKLLLGYEKEVQFFNE